MIENAGEDRHIAVQIFIDYIQVPIIIGGETYQTFFVDADKSFSKEFCFQIAETLELGKMRDEGRLPFTKAISFSKRQRRKKQLRSVEIGRTASARTI